MASMDLLLVIRSQLDPEAKKALERISTLGAQGAKGQQQLAKDAKKAGDEIGHVGTRSKLTLGVLQAFLLYKGFVFLQQGALSVTRELIELEHQVAIVQTQLSNLGKDFKKEITRNVVEIASLTGLRMSELAKAEFEVVSANIALADSYAIVELAAKAAVAGGIEDVELAFNAALSQVNAFNLSNDQFGEVFDKQFNLVKRGIFTYEQFGTVVGGVASAFAGVGQDIETANASLAAVSQVFTGSQLEQGATGLRNAVRDISDRKDEFEALGIAVTDTNGSFRNFIDIMRDVESLTSGISESARAEVLKKLFPDERGLKVMTALIEQLDFAEEVILEQQNAVGDLNEAYEEVNDTLTVQLGIMRNQLTPAFQPVVDLIGSMVRGVNSLNEELPGLTQNLIRLATALIAVRVGGAIIGKSGLTAGGAAAAGAKGLGVAGLVGTSLIGGSAASAVAQGGGSQWGRHLGAAGLGAASGAATGALLGSVLPGPGTAIGAILGGGAGAILGTLQARRVDIERAKLADEVGETVELEQMFNEAVESITDAMDGASSTLNSTMSGIKLQFDLLFKGDFSKAANLFSEMGKEGEALAESFRRLTQISQAFATLESLRAIKVAQQVETGGSKLLRDKLAEQGIFIDKPLATTPKMTSLFNEEQLAEAASIIMGEALGLDLSGASSFSGRQIADALLGEQAAEEMQMGAISFADAMFEAADLVRFGLIDGLGFAADELELMGEELRVFNRLVKQRAILEEMKALAEFAGVGTQGITGAFDILRQNMVEAGQSFFELLSDPVKLAELLTNLEFGDISVDQSSNNNFVIRVSGEIGEGQLVALEQSLVDAINRANREALAR